VTPGCFLWCDEVLAVNDVDESVLQDDPINLCTVYAKHARIEKSALENMPLCK
jgi:hypothetical protein